MPAMAVDKPGYVIVSIPACDICSPCYQGYLPSKLFFAISFVHLVENYPPPFQKQWEEFNLLKYYGLEEKKKLPKRTVVLDARDHCNFLRSAEPSDMVQLTLRNQHIAEGEKFVKKGGSEKTKLFVPFTTLGKDRTYIGTVVGFMPSYGLHIEFLNGILGFLPLPVGLDRPKKWDSVTVKVDDKHAFIRAPVVIGGPAKMNCLKVHLAGPPVATASKPADEKAEAQKGSDSKTRASAGSSSVASEARSSKLRNSPAKSPAQNEIKQPSIALFTQFELKLIRSKIRLDSTKGLSNLVKCIIDLINKQPKSKKWNKRSSIGQHAALNLEESTAFSKEGSGLSHLLFVNSSQRMRREPQHNVQMNIAQDFDKNLKHSIAYHLRQCLNANIPKEKESSIEVHCVVAQGSKKGCSYTTHPFESILYEQDKKCSSCKQTLHWNSPFDRF